MTDPITLSALSGLAASKIGELSKVGLQVGAVKSSLESGDVAPLAFGALGAGIGIVNIPLRTEYAGLFTGIGKAVSLSKETKDYLEQTLHLDPVPFEGARQFCEIMDKISSPTDLPPLVDSARCFVLRLDQLREMEQAGLKWMDDHGLQLTAKKVYYLFGSEYTPGMAEKAPVVGSVLELFSKLQLSEPITLADLARAANDVLLIVTIVTSSGGAAPAALAESAAVAKATTTKAAESALASTATVGLSPVASAAAGSQKALALRARSWISATSEVEKQAQLSRAISEVKGAEQLSKWLEGQNIQFKGNPTSVGEIAKRIGQIEQGSLGELHIERLYETDPNFAKLCNGAATALKKAKLSGVDPKIEAALRNIGSNVSGRYTQLLVRDAMRPYFNRSAIEFTTPLGGRLDILLEGARHPIYGRGFLVPEGGSLAVEIKARQVASYPGELEHMLFQARNASIADTGLTVVSRDFGGLNLAIEQRMRDALRPDSPVYAMAPAKKFVDELVHNFMKSLINKVQT